MRQFAELHQVEPCDICYPLGRFKGASLEIQCCSSLDQCLELIMFDATTLKANLEGEQKGEQELVIFIESTASVTKYFKGQVLNDILDSFVRDRRTF